MPSQKIVVISVLISIMFVARASRKARLFRQFPRIGHTSTQFCQFGTSFACGHEEGNENNPMIPMAPPTWDKWEYGTFPIGSGLNSAVTNIVQEGDHVVSKKSIARKLSPGAEQYTDEEWKEYNERGQFDPLWRCLSDEDVTKGIIALEKFVSGSRKEKMNIVLSQRTKNIRFVFENPSNANNVWAALRTMDSFGIQFVDMIFNNEAYICEWRRGTMSAALGSQKWMTLHQHDSTSDCLLQLKKDGYKIVASDLQAGSLQADRIDWRKLTEMTTSMEQIIDDSQSGGKVAIVMGNELSGITPMTRKLADHLLYIPMKGFAESLNLSVAVAVLCTQLDQQAMLKHGLGKELNNRILLTWYARSVNRSISILKRANISIPYTTLYERIHNVTSRP